MVEPRGRVGGAHVEPLEEDQYHLDFATKYNSQNKVKELSSYQNNYKTK